MSYQTILLVIQGLPRQRETLDRFSTIIGAPFKTGSRCSRVIIDAFSEFWESSYAEVNEPEGGWPASIKAALLISRQGDERSSLNHDHETSDAADNEFPNGQNLMADEAPREIPSKEEIKLNEIAVIAVVEYPIESNPLGPNTFCKPPSTPRKERQIRVSVSTPPRRRRTSSTPKTMHTLGPEPRSPLTDRRKRNAASTSFFTSPTPKASDKENVSPKPLPDIFVSVLGKRKMEPTAEDLTGYVKRKISSSRSLKTARPSGSCTVIADGDSTKTADDGVTNTPSKKRKSEVFAWVEVPTVKEVMLRRRHSAPLKEEADSQHSVFTSATTLKKSRSTARMNVVDHRNRDDLEASPRKKIRTVRSDEPIPPLVEFPGIGSGNAPRLHPRDEFETDGIDFWWIDDSIVVVDPSKTTVKLSSDDDPMKLGRYTPRLVMSPVLSSRRLNEKRWDEGDVGSDDSVEPNSPTKDVVERRKKMGWPAAQRAAEGGGILVS